MKIINNMMSGIKNIISKLFNSLSNKADIKTGTEVNNTDNTLVTPIEIEKLSELYEILQIRNPLLTNEMRSLIIKSLSVFGSLGFKDGSIGQKQLDKAYFDTYAVQLQDEAKAFLESDRARFTVESKAKGMIKELKEKIFKETEKYRNDIVTRKQLDSRRFSLGLARFYIIVAILLIIADIPLALILTQNGFNLSLSENPNYLIEKLFIPSENENIISHFVLVFANNWEVFILAGGVALCTVYIKIFYDDFIGYPTDKSVTQFRLLKDSDAIKEDEIKFIKIRYWLKIAMKTLILALTIYTVFELGLFRAAHNRNMEKVNTIAFSEDEQKQYNVPSIAPINDTKLNDLTDKTFILITILFPVIGGICLSLGFSNLQNIKELSFAEKHYLNVNKEYIESIKEHSIIETQLKSCEEYLAQCKNPKFVEQYKNLFHLSYQHGYERGVIEPDKQLDIYSRVQKLRDRLVSTKSFQAVQSNN